MSAGAVFTFDEIKDVMNLAKEGKRTITQADKVQLKATIRKDFESGLDKADETAGTELLAIRNGYTKNITLGDGGSPVTVSVGGKNIDGDEYFEKRYGANLSKVLDIGFGINTKAIRFADFCSLFGHTSNSYDTFTTPTIVDDVKGYRWLVPEVILTAVMRGYKKTSRVNAWTGNTINSSQPDNIIIPQIKDNDFEAKELQETETLDMAVHEFANKKAKVKKYGVGFAVTDEVTDRVTIDMMQTAVMSIGKKFALKEEKLAIQALQQDVFATDGTAEATLVVGTENGTSFQEIDILRAIQTLSGLGYDISTMIGNMSNVLAVQLMNIFRGYNGNKMEGTMTINDNANILKNNISSFSRALSSSNYLLLFDSSQFLSRINYKPMRIGRERIEKRGIDALYVRMHAGFVIENIQAGVILNKGAALSEAGYPANYLVESIINGQ